MGMEMGMRRSPPFRVCVGMDMETEMEMKMEMGIQMETEM